MKFKFKKNWCISILVLAFLLPVYSKSAKLPDAPELWGFSPTNYMSLKKVDFSEQDTAFVGMRSKIKQELSFSEEFSMFAEKYSCLEFYEQVVDNKIFYRVFASAAELERFPFFTEGDYSEHDAIELYSSEKAVVQFVFYKTASGVYYVDSAVFGLWRRSNESGLTVDYEDFNIISSNKYIVLVKNTVTAQIETGIRKNGKIHLRCSRVNYKDTAFQNTVINFYDASAYGIEKKNFYCNLESENFLFIAASPLSNSILCALDNCPDTCYIVNSSDNYVSLKFYFTADTEFENNFGKVKFLQAKVMNGDCSSKENYFDASRIKTFSISAKKIGDSFIRDEKFSFTLKDFDLDLQLVYIPFAANKNFIQFETSGIYDGKKNNVSCISGFNLNLQNFGWIF